ncbi:hypothetical protein CSAL01_05096 [Colletotrichum salicis]|uniref:Uncharacterized protein n=1 Tax=Colletotrichum salicis TaxID=1209931 RepID=A0A135RWR7_9PEZI|nr:hypothetical protein CSAL01_05096 [Colletotrichum salicis]
MTLEITGNLQKRFVQDAVLLHQLNPVRGSPTAYGLDRHPHDTDVSREVFLKRKFLASFALLASTHKDGDRVSAATLEVGAPEGSIVRIASNAGVCASTLVLLRDVMEDLQNVSVMGLTDERRMSVLLKIISLDSPKIRHYFAELRKHRSDILRTEQFLSQLFSTFNPNEIEKFFTWMGNLSAITTVTAEASPLELLPYILWAEKAKWEFSTYLEAVFSAQCIDSPVWIYSIYKLGRYAVASRALCQLPAEYRGLFCPMRIEAVEPFERLEFIMKENELPLRDTLRRFVGGQEEEFARRLATIWGVTNPEPRFREACHLQLAVHAELQLIAFYDQNPELMPPFRFMGLDSTAGVSLTGLVNYRPPSPAESLNTTDACSPPGSSIKSSPDSPENEDDEAPGRIPPTRGEELSPKQAGQSNPKRQSHYLHRRDLAASEDILDVSQKPSWQKLVEILSDIEHFGVHYVEEKEFLVIDENLWVRNERQFHACLQFLRNSGCRNVGIEVRTYDSLSLKTT